MEKELQRAKGELGKLTPAAYFISYTVYDQQVSFAVGINGSLVTSTTGRKRMADVIMRVGTPALDNAHGENRPSAINTETLPLDDDAGRDCSCALAADFQRVPQGLQRVSQRADQVAGEGQGRRPVGGLQQGDGAGPRRLQGSGPAPEQKADGEILCAASRRPSESIHTFIPPA